MNERYKQFMYGKSNCMNCEDCPENRGFDPWPENRLPCGQFHCWVDCHCHSGDENEED